jgi:hypothetical protein
MAVPQGEIISKGFHVHEIANMDETGLNYGLGPTHVFCPEDAERGEQECTDEKARVTAIVTVLATGEFLPCVFILKHSKSSLTDPDQTSMTVIKRLHKKAGFTAAEGWVPKIWERELSIESRKKEVVRAVHKVRYLLNTRTGVVITSQFKAWNDTVRMAMLCDLVYGPYIASNCNAASKLLIWMDNFSAHKTETLKHVFEENKLTVAYLPPNMTYLLQVLDLVVNGPIKNHVRCQRAKSIFDYLQDFRRHFNAELQKPYDDRKMPKWGPPKPTLFGCITDILHLFHAGGNFTTDQFKAMVQKSFLKTGCAPNADGVFTRYVDTDTKGSFSYAPTGTIKKSEFPAGEALNRSILDSIFFEEDDEESEPANSVID